MSSANSSPKPASNSIVSKDRCGRDGGGGSGFPLDFFVSGVLGCDCARDPDCVGAVEGAGGNTLGGGPLGAPARAIVPTPTVGWYGVDSFRRCQARSPRPSILAEGGGEAILCVDFVRLCVVDIVFIPNCDEDALSMGLLGRRQCTAELAASSTWT